MRISPAILATLMAVSASTYAEAQTVTPADRDQARREAERQAAEREQRQDAPVVSLPEEAPPVLGPIPRGETPCFAINTIIVNGIDDFRRLRWVPRHLEQYRGRCLGAQGLDHVLRSLQAQFLERGLITTRAGLPEQDLTSGTMVVQVVPGTVSGIRTNGTEGGRSWSIAAPLGVGDLVTLRALEQGIEQMRRIPNREVSAELAPGADVGESIIDVTSRQKRSFGLSVSADNYAGIAVGRWQASAQVAALNLLGASEIFSASYNRRIDSPGIPADSRGYGASLSFPMGWWTFGVSGSRNRYDQHIVGEVAEFDTLGRQSNVSGFVERVIQRDQTSKTSLRASLTRRWGRNYIEDVEIGIQRQDVTDLTLSVIDRRALGRFRVNSEIAYRMGIGILGAQDEDGRPGVLPTSRYRIVTADIAAQLPINKGALDAWSIAFRGQVSRDTLYGSDSIAIGGPFTVRGFESDRAEMGRSGWYLRQELSFKIGEAVHPFVLADMGHVRRGSGLLAGLGGGLRAYWQGFRFDGFVAVPVSHLPQWMSRKATVGVSVGWSL
jgi:hemolysin activation/secretion protein